jgi:hypothetical protein
MPALFESLPKLLRLDVGHTFLPEVDHAVRDAPHPGRPPAVDMPAGGLLKISKPMGRNCGKSRNLLL